MILFLEMANSKKNKNSNASDNNENVEESENTQNQVAEETVAVHEENVVPRSNSDAAIMEELLSAMKGLSNDVSNVSSRLLMIEFNQEQSDNEVMKLRTEFRSSDSHVEDQDTSSPTDRFPTHRFYERYPTNRFPTDRFRDRDEGYRRPEKSDEPFPNTVNKKTAHHLREVEPGYVRFHNQDPQEETDYAYFNTAGNGVFKTNKHNDEDNINDYSLLEEVRNPKLHSASKFYDRKDFDSRDQDNNDKEAFPFENNARVNMAGRRLSVEGIPRVIPGVANAFNNAATVMVAPYVVTEGEKMKFITLKSIKRLMEQYAVFKASSLDNTKTLIFFINTECQVKLIAKQMLLRNPISKWITPQNVFLTKDEHVGNMLCDYIRPTSRDDFVVLFNQAMTHPRWRRDLEFNTVNYYKDIFPHVVLFLEECEIYDENLRHGASSFELKFMPKYEWGKSDPGGMFRIAIAILHPYQDNFIQLLQEERLKKLTSMKQFIHYFSEKNAEISQLSLDILRQNNTLKKPTGYATITAQARKKSDEYKEYKDKVAKRTDTPRKSTFNKYNRNKASLNSIEEADVPENGEDESFIQPSVLEDSDDEDQDMTEEEWNQNWEDRNDHKDWVTRELRNWDESEVKLALDALCAIEPTYTPRRNHDGVRIYKAKPVNKKDQVCFAYAFGKCTGGSTCEYSHDPSKVKGFLKTSYERLVGSPGWDPRIVAEVGTTKSSTQKDQTRRDNNMSNHDSSRGKGAFQSPATDHKKAPYSNNYGKSYLVEGPSMLSGDVSGAVHIGNTEKKSSDLSGTGVDQPLSTEKSGSLRVASTSASRDDPDC